LDRKVVFTDSSALVFLDLNLPNMVRAFGPRPDSRLFDKSDMPILLKGVVLSNSKSKSPCELFAYFFFKVSTLLFL